MSTFHAVVWMDHQEAHVVMFDREHVEAQRIQSRSHHKHQGKAGDMAAFYAEVAQALAGTHEVLVTVTGARPTKKAPPQPSSTASPVTTPLTASWWLWPNFTSKNLT